MQHTKSSKIYAALMLVFCAAAAVPAHTAGAAETGRLFSTPDEAVQALADAAKAKDIKALADIFGPASQELIESSDEVARNNAMNEFNQSYSEQHELVSRNDAVRILVVGGNKWPFPIPLVQTKGKWFFDTAAGSEEIINRRIGENELTALAVCRGYVAAQTEYAAGDAAGGEAQFAAKIMSSPGKRDGLFWPVKEGEKESPLGPFLAKAAAEGYTDKTAEPDPFHGYFFRILTAQGPAARGGKKTYIEDGRMIHGFGLIAYPANWGKSGIMTFVVNQDGNVYQKNLGPKTAEIAAKQSDYNPDKSWKRVNDELDP